MKRLKGNWLSKFFDNDLLVKIFSVVVAVIGWFLVALIVSPDAVATINNIPVRVATEKSTAQQMGLDVVEGGDQVISITVKGKRYQVGALTADDFDVVAYPTSVSTAGEYELEVVVQKVDTTKEFEILSWNPGKMTVRFDRIASKTFDLSAEAPNVKVADGFIKGDPVATVSPKQITITGPEQNVNRIDKNRCIVRTDVDDEISGTLTAKGTLEIYDVDGQLMDLDANKFTLSAKEFSVTIPVLKQKTLPLTFDYLNAPSGFSAASLKYSMSSSFIQVAAPVEVIDNMTELKIGYIDFKQLGLNYSKDFEIELPTGFKNITNLTKVTVTFDTSDLTTKTTWISNSNLKLTNIPANYNARAITRTINSVKLVGSKQELVGISYQDVVGEIDLMNTDIKGKGQYTVPVTIKFPSKNGVWAVGEYTAVVYVWE